MRNPEPEGRIRTNDIDMHYVILGMGVAGIEAALSLRARDEAARITIVSDEHDHFFSRPALMYVYCGQMSLRDTEPYDRGLFDRMKFERFRGRVATVDVQAKALRCEDGRSLSYDRLLIACGSKARSAPWPGSQGTGVHRFVTLHDLDAVNAATQRGQRAVVIGGGLIGVEAAEILHHRGLHVTFVIREDWYFPLALDRNESAIVAEHMRACGIDVRLGAGVASIQRNDSGSVTGVQLEGAAGAAPGDLVPADVVVVSIGVEPNTAFLASSGIGMSKGGAIETDDGLRTSAPDVWAAGDCANVTWNDGSRRPEQLWYTARDQGRIAARSMMGDPVTYRRGAWYNSAKFFDIEWTTAGDVPAMVKPGGGSVSLPPNTRVWFQRVPGKPISQKIVVRGNAVQGFNFLGSRFDHEPLLRWIAERRDLDYVLARLGDTQFDEEFSPRFKVLPSATVTS